MRRRWILLLAIVFGLAPALAHAALPRVARPSLPGKGKSAVDARGLIFFLALKDGGVAAVGTAHTFTPEDVARAGRTDFYLGTTFKRVGSSSRFLVPPGRSFSAPGASMREDFWVYALDEPPQGVGKLETDAGPVKVGERVALLGVQERGKRDEDNLFGSVVTSTPTRLEIDLDLPGTLRGWGGAPILRISNQKVIGIVEAHVSQDGTSRVIAAPIGGVVEALAKPLETSKAAFSQFASVEGAEAPAPPPPLGSALPHPDVKKLPVLDRHSDEPTSVQVSFEYPPPGSVVGESACGVFVAGQAQASRGDRRRFDVVIVIDTSRSTIDPSGADVNGNGVIGRQRLGGLGTIFGSGSTDPGDSVLAAEVAGARTLLHGLDARTTRVGVVVFAGDVPGTGRRSRPAYTMVALTNEYDRVEASLDEILATEPEGNTHMAAGVDQATIELAGLRGAASRVDPESEKIVFFFTDGQPTLPYGPEAEADNVRAVLRAANRAHRAGIRIHSFAVGPEALEGPISTVEMASRTDGYFTPVRNPGDLANVVEDVNLANLDSIDLQNRTTKKAARYFRATADGSWAGFVDLDNGRNLLNAKAVADDGATGDGDLDVRLDPQAKSPPVPKELAARRNRLLEECLRDLKRKRVTAEQEQAEQVRRDLQLEIEKERAKAKAQAEKQRKELEIDVGTDDVQQDKK
ncbi:MAG TPA: VWA domain-containing protein [Myxococcota bacterium]|nr:VWA domain-containing protein [Myxococcota bacterium]